MIKIFSKKTYKKIALIWAIFFCFSQGFTQVDSSSTKFSFGFDGSRVFNQLFRAYPYSSLLYLEHQFSSKYAVRLAGDAEQVSGDEGKLDYQTKLGLKRHILRKNNWIFYLGVDGVFEYEFNRNTQVKQHTEGSLVYIGATCKFGNYFSLTTEPSLYFVFKQKKDLDSFDSTTKYSNFQGFTQVGLVRASFHF
jgi:hypothetical protein